MKLLKSKTAVGLLCSLSLLAACATESEFSARSSKANASNPSSFGGENTDLDAAESLVRVSEENTLTRKRGY